MRGRGGGGSGNGGGRRGVGWSRSDVNWWPSEKTLLLLDGGSIGRGSLGALRKPHHALVLVQQVTASGDHFLS